MNSGVPDSSFHPHGFSLSLDELSLLAPQNIMLKSSSPDSVNVTLIGNKGFADDQVMEKFRHRQRQKEDGVNRHREKTAIHTPRKA